jgi:hypothetical protein
VRREIVNVRGFSNELEVADSVAEEHARAQDGSVVVVPNETVFTKSIADAVPTVKQGHPSWGKVVAFYRECYNATAHGAEGGEAREEEVRAKDPTAEEYYELAPEYRRRRLALLKDARHSEIDDARLPSDRLWGRVERLRRVNKEFEAIVHTKLQSVEAARRSTKRAALQPGAGGVLAWRLPAINEPPPSSLVEFEDAMYVLENLLCLTGWVTELRPLQTFHERFWCRVRKAQNPVTGYRALTLKELQEAHSLFQRQWARASRDSATLDAAILASLPADTDELDGRLALAPRVLTHEPRKRDRDDNRGVGAEVKAEAEGAEPGHQGEPKKKKPRGQDKCKFFHKNGTCRYGANCRFQH